MPRRPSFSPTKFSTYLACPVKYYWTYVSDRGRWLLRSKSYYSFGSSLHRVLERFHDSDDRGVTTTEEAVAALEESWIEAGYSSQEEMMDMLNLGKEMVSTYVQAQVSRPSDAKPVLIERRLRMSFDRFDLIGQVDRVDEHSDGSLEVIDYKSGRENVTAEQVENDLAMGIYQLLVANEFPGQDVRATIIALRSGKQATASMDENGRTLLVNAVSTLGGEILDRDWEEIVPKPKPLCQTCDFLPLCQKYPEFELNELPQLEEQREDRR